MSFHPKLKLTRPFPAQANGQSRSSPFPDGRTSFSEGAIVGTRRLLEIEQTGIGSRVAGYAIVGGNEEDTFHLHQTHSDSGAVNFVHLETIR